MLLRMKKALFFVLLISAWATLLCGQARDTEAQIEAKCDKYLQTPLPAEAALIVAPKTWPECDSPKLYSGIGVKVDYAAARKCAWAERLAIQAEIEPVDFAPADVLGGSSMLAVLYANGEGVEQNIPLAGRFACEAGIGNGLREIEALPLKPGGIKKKFASCDAEETTIGINACYKHSSEIDGQKRTNALRNLSSRWPKAQQTAFATVVKLENDYAIDHAQGEIDLGGTMSGLRAMSTEDRLRDKLLAAMRSFESGHLPHGTVSDFNKADAELNLLYCKAVAASDAHKKNWDGAIQPEGIQKAQSAWLKYRDEWIAFAKLRYPSTNANAWLTLLTTNRVASLRMTLCGIDDKDSSCPKR
jgi:uncharacterized protein YecT (DUF1311 family)